MASKSRKGNVRPKQKQSKKWSRSNIINYVLGVFVALSMVLGSVFAFAPSSPRSVAAQTPIIDQLASTPTPSALVTPVPAATPTP
ncbi:MAG TPA: hypothetical protein VIX58_07710 [Anaerolineae bacterium]